MLTAVKEIDCCCNPTNKEGENRDTYMFPSVFHPLYSLSSQSLCSSKNGLTPFATVFSELLATRDNTSSQQPPSHETVKSYFSLHHSR